MIYFFYADVYSTKVSKTNEAMSVYCQLIYKLNIYAIPNFAREFYST